jgi:hypothetical protein
MCFLKYDKTYFILKYRVSKRLPDTESNSILAKPLVLFNTHLTKKILEESQENGVSKHGCNFNFIVAMSVQVWLLLL